MRPGSEGPRFKPVNVAVIAEYKRYLVLQAAIVQMLVINLVGEGMLGEK